MCQGCCTPSGVAAAPARRPGRWLAFRQALFALVWFRKREDVTVLAAGFGISRATGYRYRDEAVAVLAARAPSWPGPSTGVREEGWAFVIIDGHDSGFARTTCRPDCCR
jgi:hypothetical protein